MRGQRPRMSECSQHGLSTEPHASYSISVSHKYRLPNQRLLFGEIGVLLGQQRTGKHMLQRNVVNVRGRLLLNNPGHQPCHFIQENLAYDFYNFAYRIFDN